MLVRGEEGEEGEGGEGGERGGNNKRVEIMGETILLKKT